MAPAAILLGAVGEPRLFGEYIKKTGTSICCLVPEQLVKQETKLCGLRSVLYVD